MALYEDLTQAEKDTLHTTEKMLRPLTGEAARLLTKIRALCLDYNTNSKAIFDTLTTTEEIANTTGLSGAQPLAVEEIQRLMVGFEYLAAAYGTEEAQSDQVKAAGACNTI